jgi:hypothetical protein
LTRALVSRRILEHLGLPADVPEPRPARRDKSLDWGPTAYDLRHAFQAYWSFDLPFGRERHFTIDNALVDQIFGGWALFGIARLQSGRPFLLTSGRWTVNQNDGGVVLNGITVKELQKMVTTRPGPNGNV